MAIKKQGRTIVMGLCHSAGSIWLMLTCQAVANWIKAMGLIALFGMCSCTGPMGTIGRLVPDGSSGSMNGIHLNLSMTGAGSAQIDSIIWVGTNGFPVPGMTNAATITTVPKGTTLQVK